MADDLTKRDLTLSEFEEMRGERWSLSFKVRLGLRATKLYEALYGKRPAKPRAPTGWRNRCCKYPPAIIEQAYRGLAEPVAGVHEQAA